MFMSVRDAESEILVEIFNNINSNKVRASQDQDVLILNWDALTSSWTLCR